MRHAGDLRGRVEGLVGMDTLLPVLAATGHPVYLVGGAVRDLLLDRPVLDLDVTVEGPAPEVAREVAARLGAAPPEEHERFGTATLHLDDLTLDLATSRRERYPEAGALPDVEPAPIGEDLGRRDFTVNAMAIALSPGDRDRLLDPYDGRAELEAGLIRVLHPRSFVDDPTRLLRAVRYAARLGFALEAETDRVARAAIADRVSDTVSGKRIGSELMLLLAEDERAAALAGVRSLGLDRALHPALDAVPELAGAAARAAPTVEAEPALAALAALLRTDPDELETWVGDLGLPAGARDRAIRAARAAPQLAAELADPGRALGDADLAERLGDEPPETFALAIALGAPREPVVRYLTTVRDVGLDIGGDDLIAAGVPASPALGRALAETLRRKRDGEIAGREAELRVALELARSAEDAG